MCVEKYAMKWVHLQEGWRDRDLAQIGISCLSWFCQLQWNPINAPIELMSDLVCVQGI